MPHLYVALLLVLCQEPARGPAYRIAARLDEVAGTLTARAEVVVRTATGEPLNAFVFTIPRSVHLDQVRIGRVSQPLAAAASGLVTVLLPRGMSPTDSVTIELAWTAQPIRRQGREFAFAAWQPRLAGFANVLLRLDVPADQVVSGTGTLLCGDPGWRPLRRPTDRITLQGAIVPGGVATIDARCDSSAVAPGRKTLVWHAENVPEVALALSPDFQYEEGDILGHPMRAFYRAADAYAWGAGAAVSHLETALAWLDEIFGSYPWPHATVVHTAEAPDTVVAMQLWGTNADQLHVMRELGRMYAGRLVSVRDPADAWLEEGLARFQATWYLETEGVRRPTTQLEHDVLTWDLDGISQPIAQPRSTFHDSATAAAMIGRRGEFFLHELRAIVGDSAMRSALHTYFARNRFSDVDEAAFRAAVEQTSHRDLRGTFAQWLRGTQLIDYSVGHATRQRTGTGWRTDVRVDAHGSARFPVTVLVLTDIDTGTATANGRDAREQLTVVTRGRPQRVLIDPDGQSHDWNTLNNQRTFGWRFGRDRPTSRYLDTYFGKRSQRDRVTLGIAPIAWRTDRDGWTVGLRRRDNYLGRFELNEMVFAVSTGWGVPADRAIPHGSIVLRNPVSLRATGWSQRLGALWLDGRAGANVGVEWSRRRSVAVPARRALGLSLDWVTVQTPEYVDPLVYDDAGTLELTASARANPSSGAWNTRVTVALAGGYQFAHTGAAPVRRDATYGRITATATTRSDSAARLRLGVRLYGGLTFSHSAVVRQRRIYLAGADPYERLTSPFLRSPGALLARADVRYHAPGGAGMRGLDPRLAADQAYGVSVETEATLWRRHGGLARRARVALFADGALADDGFGPAASSALLSVAEAGAGIRIDHRLGATSFQTRWDFPVWISRPALAQDREIGWRWVFSFNPAF